LGDDTGPRFDDRDRDHPAPLIEDLGHTDLLAQNRFNHFSTPSGFPARYLTAEDAESAEKGKRGWERHPLDAQLTLIPYPQERSAISAFSAVKSAGPKAKTVSELDLDVHAAGEVESHQGVDG